MFRVEVLEKKGQKSRETCNPNSAHGDVMRKIAKKITM